MADSRYPKSWKDMSLDMRLMFGYHLSMMAMFIAGGYFTVRQEVSIAGVIAAAIALVAGRYRQKRHWRWPGVKVLDLLYALGGVVVMAFFLYAATPLFPPNNGQTVPWYLAGLGIGLFNVSQSLKIISSSEAEFAANCMIIDQYGRELEPVKEPAPTELTEQSWKRVAKFIFTALFVLVWICGVASFYFFGSAFKNDSPGPTATQTEPLKDHGKTVYVTPDEKQRIHILELVSWVGVPVVLIAGVVLHFLMGVKLFPNAPTLSEYLNRSTNKPSP